MANAENNHKLDPQKLVVTAITATEGPSLKRFRPRARGSAASILKRSTHITVLVEEVEPVVSKKKEAKGVKTAPAVTASAEQKTPEKKTTAKKAPAKRKEAK
jgi:hypothetical protein